MDREKDSQRVSIIVPAYNEGERLGAVLSVLTSCQGFREIIVIDDGSTDDTGKVAQRYPVRYVRNEVNRGKGYSMDRAVSLAQGDIILFIDADVSGLTCQIVREIAQPVLDGKVEMFIGMRNRKIYYLHYFLLFVPLLGGERALTKELWQRLPDYYKHYFRIEAGLNFYARHYGHDFDFKVFKGLAQVIKEKKYGLWKGLKQRWRLISDVTTAQFKLQFVDIPKNSRNRRLGILVSLQSLAMAVLGFLLCVAAYMGPHRFILDVFRKELAEDPGAPFIHYLLYLASIVSIKIILIFGLILFVFNLPYFLLHLNSFSGLLSFITKKAKNKA